MTEKEYPWRIPLHARNGSVRAWALVDESDYASIGDLSWCMNPGGYAVRKKDGQVVYMHRELLGLVIGDTRQVDHMNRDKLDNRRANLRLADQRANVQNTGSRRGSSRYRGVTRRGRRWVAQAGKRDATGYERMHYLGIFDDERDAAAAAAQWRDQNLPGAIESSDLLERAIP